MTRAELEVIEARANAATPGPWRICGAERGGCVCRLIWSIPCDRTVLGVLPDTQNEEPNGPTADLANTIFAAHARTDVPLLVALVRKLGGDRIENAGGCSIRGCLGPMLADSEDWSTPLCAEHFEDIGARFGAVE